MTRAPVELSAVVVHYRAAELAARAVARLREDLVAVDGGSEVLLVDNGSDAAGRALLENLPVRLIDSGGNVGYAGGVNLGAAAARGRVLVFLNPDVLVLPGCCSALLAALAAGAAAAGPRFYWDEGRRMRLPPPEPTSRAAALLRALAPRSPRLAAFARRRWRRHARRQWRATAPYATAHLSGALLAVRRDAWERVGPFDEGYRLYFEETDWLRRLTAQGLAARFVPAAEAIHLYDASGRVEPRSREWFAASAERFRRRHLGRRFSALLAALERGAPAAADGARAAGTLPAGIPGLDLATPPGSPAPHWVELSPSPLGFPAAGEPVEPREGRLRWRLPEEIWERLEPQRYRLTVADGAGAEWASFRVERPPAPPAAAG